MSMSIPLGAQAIASGLSGMRAAQRSLDTTAHNIANAQTPGFQRQTVERTEMAGSGGVSTTIHQAPRPETATEATGLDHIAQDLVEQRMSLYSFSANLKTVQTQDHVIGTLLDAKA